MIIEVKIDDVYIPTFGGNDKLPDDEKLKVKHRFLLPGERKKYIYTKPMQIDKISGKLDSSVEYVQDEEGITKAIVTGFENFKIKIDKKEVEIKTALDMYNHNVPTSLVREIEVAMLLASPEVDKDFL